MSDMRQGFYYHTNRIRMSITEARIKSASGDIQGLLDWCALLYELYTILSYWITKEEDITFFEELAEIEDKIIETKNLLVGAKSYDAAIKWQSNKDFITNYSIVQKKLHLRQKTLYAMMVKNKMVVPMDDAIDPYSRWEIEAGAEDGIN